MKPQIYHVDAFTSEPFRGNSAGVVLHADTLSDAQMQLIARELRHSETAFLLKSEESDDRDCGRSGNGKRQWPDGSMARPSWPDGA